MLTAASRIRVDIWPRHSWFDLWLAKRFTIPSLYKNQRRRGTINHREAVVRLPIELRATCCRARCLSIPSPMGVSRAMPEDDLLNQFLAEPPGQWTGAQ